VNPIRNSVCPFDEKGTIERLGADCIEVECRVIIVYDYHFADFQLEVYYIALLVNPVSYIVVEEIEFYIVVIQAVGSFIKELILLNELIERIGPFSSDQINLV
jgi:hypothetical protein